MRYFAIMSGLRGCYMPDNSFCVSVQTRRELKGILREQADYATDSCLSPAEARAAGERYSIPDRKVASVAAALWRRSARDRDSYLSTVIPYGTDNAFGIQVNPITRGEYLESKESDHA